MNKIIGVVVGFLALIVAVAASGLYTVDEGERAVVLTNGSFSEVSAPGLHYKIPLVQSVKYITVRDEKTSLVLPSFSYDNQTADLEVSLNFVVKPENVETVYRRYGSVENAVERALAPKVKEAIKNVFGRYTARRSIQERQAMNATMQAALLDATDNTGITVTSFQLENIDFSTAYERAAEDTATATAKVETAKRELERVEQEAQQAVKQAEAAAMAAKLKADADSYATMMNGKATADAIRLRGLALRDNPLLIQLVLAEKWDGELPTSMVPGSAVPFVNVSPQEPSIIPQK